jgi:4-hydroxy-3-methylbut-2-enyl diphosphate reductase
VVVGGSAGRRGAVEDGAARLTDGMGTVLLAQPRSFCAGVSRAVETVERALRSLGAPVYVRRQVVHNTHVVSRLEGLGAVFVDEVDAVPAGEWVILSAHGVAPAVRAAARARGLRVVDATCPLVDKVHREVVRFAEQGYEIFLLGQPAHDEVVGTVGEAPGRVHVISCPRDVDLVRVADPGRVVWLAQTTLVLAETEHLARLLRARFPALSDPPSSDVCYAAQNRQTAVREMARSAGLVLVVGSRNSHNSRELVRCARDAGVPARLVDGVADCDPGWLPGIDTVGLTAGASAPEDRVREVQQWLAEHGFRDHRTVRVARESQIFALPKELAYLSA